MNRLLLAATAIASLAVAATPAAAQRHWRGHGGGRSSFSLVIGGGYGPSYGYAPYAYGYDPYAYGYDPYYGAAYYDYPAYGYSRGYDRYYGGSYYNDRRHHRRHRDDRRDRWDGYYRR